MSLSAGGCDNNYQLGIGPTSQNKNGAACVDVVTPVPFDLDGIQCISAGKDHSVIIKFGNVYATGIDKTFYIGSDSRKTYKEFTEIKISEEPISWAACGNHFTIYLTVNGNAILCHQKAKGERIIVQIDKKAVCVFAGCSYGGIIDEEGSIHILDKDAPRKTPQRFSLPAPAVDIACCDSFVCALTKDGKVFANKKLNNNSQDFVEVPSLNNIKVVKLSGYCDTCAALTSDGHVYICGKNNIGQFGNGTTADNYTFTEVGIEEEIKDVSCSSHTLFATKSNKIFGCGINYHCQLFNKKEEEKFSTIIQIAEIKVDKVITSIYSSFILSGTGRLDNPAYMIFVKGKNGLNAIEPVAKQNNDKVDVSELLEKIEEQAQQNIVLNEKIDSLVTLCTRLVQIGESNRNEIQELKNELKIQTQKNEEMSEKLNQVTKYISEQDFY